MKATGKLGNGVTDEIPRPIRAIGRITPVDGIVRFQVLNRLANVLVLGRAIVFLEELFKRELHPLGTVMMITGMATPHSGAIAHPRTTSVHREAGDAGVRHGKHVIMIE